MRDEFAGENALSTARPLIIGHRGAAAVAPENTFESFARAFADGADGIEFDVRLSRDGVPVVIHDASLRRTASANAKVSELTAEELSRADVGTWFNKRFPQCARPEYVGASVPTLARTLAEFRAEARVFYVEMKCEGDEFITLAPAVAKEILASDRQDRIVVESFNLAAIKEIKKFAPALRTAALFEPKFMRPRPLARSLAERCLDSGAEEIALHRLLVTHRVVEESRKRNLDVVVWTVDDPAWVARAATMRLRALITNHPARLAAPARN